MRILFWVCLFAVFFNGCLIRFVFSLACVRLGIVVLHCNCCFGAGCCMGHFGVAVCFLWLGLDLLYVAASVIYVVCSQSACPTQLFSYIYLMTICIILALFFNRF